MFALGAVIATQSALQAMLRLGIGPSAFVDRHKVGDWGDLDEDFKRENDTSVRHGFRVLSAYNIGGERFYVVTESDRSITTIFLHEYY